MFDFVHGCTDAEFETRPLQVPMYGDQKSLENLAGIFFGTGISDEKVSRAVFPLCRSGNLYWEFRNRYCATLDMVRDFRRRRTSVSGRSSSS